MSCCPYTLISDSVLCRSFHPHPTILFSCLSVQLLCSSVSCSLYLALFRLLSGLSLSLSFSLSLSHMLPEQTALCIQDALFQLWREREKSYLPCSSYCQSSLLAALPYLFCLRTMIKAKALLASCSSHSGPLSLTYCV